MKESVIRKYCVKHMLVWWKFYDKATCPSCLNAALHAEVERLQAANKYLRSQLIGRDEHEQKYRSSHVL